MPGSPTTIEDAMARWYANAPSRYTMRMRGKPSVVYEWVDVVVEGTGDEARVVSVHDAETGEPRDLDDGNTMDGLYEVYAAEFAGCPCLTIHVATGLETDGVLSQLRAVDDDGDVLFLVEIGGFWVG
jgi:hypothetical protein